MTPIPWPLAVRYAATAIALPFGAAAAIALGLASLSGGQAALAAGYAPLALLIAVVATGLLALAVRRRAPRTRMGAVGQALLVAAVAIVAVLVIAAVIADAVAPHAGDTTSSSVAFAPFAAGFAIGMFALLGGPLWVAVGVALGAPLLGIRPEPPLRAPAIGAALLGTATAGGALVLAGLGRSAAHAARACVGSASVLGGEATAAWGWFPLGWTCVVDGGTVPPPWALTFAFALGLGAVALGLCLWATSRPPRRPIAPSDARGASGAGV